MPPKSHKNKTALSREFLKGLWEKIGADNWFELAQEFKPEGKWKKSGSVIRGLCLEHQETNPSMDVVIEKGLVYCHGCGYREWNPLDFYRLLTGYSTVNVIGDLALRFQIKFPSKIAERIQASKDHNDMKLALFRACNLEFREQLLHTEPYAERAINWLMSRNLDFSASQLWPIGIVPPVGKIPALLEKSRQSQLAPMIHSYLYPEKTFGVVGHVALFPFSSPTTIGHVKIREPFSKTFRVLADEFTDHMEGFFGLNTFAHRVGNLQETPVYAVEGEFDALSLYSHSQACGHDLCVIATGGNFETNLSGLADFGIQEVYLVPDNDKGGIAWAHNIFRRSPNVRGAFAWPSTIDERIDPEEAVGKFGFAEFWHQVEEHLLSRADWAYDTLASQIIDADDVTKIERVSHLAKCLYDADRAAFLNKVQTEHHIDASLIPATGSNFDDESVQGFVLKIAKDLQERFLPLYYEDSSSIRTFSVYHHERREIATLPIGKGIDRSRAEIQRHVGLPLEDYFGRLGEPLEVTCKFGKDGTPTPKPYESVTRLRNLCLQQSIEMTNLKSTPRGQIEELKRGVHFVENALYISNGPTLIKGEIADGEMIFSNMDSPLVASNEGRSTLFVPNSAPWSEFIHSPDDLYEGRGYDLKEIYQTIVHLLKSWILAERENGISQKILAADLLYTTIASAFPIMTMTRLTGPASSGKSAMMSFLYRSRGHDGFYLCEAADYLDSYSWAAVRSIIGGSTLRVCLDEFEQSNRPGHSKQSEAVDSVLQNVRNMSIGARSVKGTADMRHTEFRVNCPVTVAGIHSMNEYRDLSRFIPIETMRIESYKSPFSIIREQMNPAQIRELRKRVTLCMFHHIPAIRAMYDAMVFELSKFGILQRLMDSLTPAACILKLAGEEDYLTTIEQFARLKATQIGNAVDDDDAAPLIKTILRTPFPSFMVASNYPKSIVQLEELLKDPSAHDLSSVGVFLLDHRYLLVRWIELASTVLGNARNFRFRSPQRLRSTLASSKYDIPKTSLSVTLQTKINDLVGASASEYDYSILDLESLGVSVQNYHPSLVAPVAPIAQITQADSLAQFSEI